MKLNVGIGDCEVYHSVADSFGILLRDALNGKNVAAALGPIYQSDPAEAILAPFSKSARESNWKVSDEVGLAPDHVLESVRQTRAVEIIRQISSGLLISPVDVNIWTRAGLVLEIATRYGIHVTGQGVLHPRWNLNGTITGRFGCEPVRKIGYTFNPLSLGPDDRWRIRASAPERRVAVLDFSAMDLCSMVSLVPGLAERYGDAPDMHMRTVELLSDGGTRPLQFNDLAYVRDRFKQLLFVYAYGGVVDPWVLDLFTDKIPELGWFSGMPHGEGARRVQSQSSLAFRAGLSAALPRLVGPHLLPMFTVHDELTLDSSEEGLDMLDGLAKAIGEGASQRIGVPYRVGIKVGSTYEDAKNG